MLGTGRGPKTMYGRLLGCVRAYAGFSINTIYVFNSYCSSRLSDVAGIFV